jgi:hypothetical protein
LFKSDKARGFLKQVNNKYPSLPFSLRAFDDQTMVRIDVKHCVDNELIEVFTVVKEEKSEFVAHWKAKVAVLVKGTAFLSGNLPLGQGHFETEHKIESQRLKDLLAQSMDLKNKRRREGRIVPNLPRKILKLKKKSNY